MRLNVFRIPTAEVVGLDQKLVSSGMEVIKEVAQVGWHGRFYYSTDPRASEAGWADDFRSYFDTVGLPTNRNHYASFVFTRDDICYALTFGKSHFYVRPYCDYDFGVEIAKRIANEDDIRQTSARRFQGKRKKDIKSYATNSRLDVESGESVDFIQASIVQRHQEVFGKAGKFGSSVLLAPDITNEAIGDFLTKLHGVLSTPARFQLPRTTLITEATEIEHFDEMLVDELLSQIGTSQFQHNTYDLYGVDFVFSNDGTFVLSCPGAARTEYDDLSMRDLKLYIRDQQIARSDVLKIKVRVQPEGAPGYTKSIKEAVDFIDDNKRVLLTNGKWMQFNQDYLDFLDGYLRTVAVEVVEPQFQDIAVTEPQFNSSPEVRAAGYEVADKNFDIFRVRSATPVEAWDLRRGDRVYAVKFATPQKLGYVCDQAMAVLELFRNRAEVAEVPEFHSYCLWLGYRAQGQLQSITETGSIILKQKMEAWARKARDLGIEPVVKISRKVKPGVDVASDTEVGPAPGGAC